MPSIGTSHRAPGRARRDVFVRESVGETRFPFHRSAKVARAMDRSDAELFTLRVGDTHTVSGLLSAPPHPRACYVLAHGAGAGMSHPFMEAVATELAQRGIATLRYHFPFMEQGAKRPDPPKLAHATVRGRGGASRPDFARSCSCGGRQIIRWSHYLAGAGRVRAAWGPR